MSTLGTELKINVHVEPIDGLHMKDYEFECVFYVYGKNRVILKKNEMKYVDDDNYVAIINHNNALIIGRGEIKMEFEAHVPDSDFENGFRIEKTNVCTGITIS